MHLPTCMCAVRVMCKMILLDRAREPENAEHLHVHRCVDTLNNGGFSLTLAMRCGALNVPTRPPLASCGATLWPWLCRICSPGSVVSVPREVVYLPLEV